VGVIQAFKYEDASIEEKPLLGVIGAIHECVAQLRVLPQAVLVDQHLQADLAARFEKVFFKPFEGYVYYFTGVRTEQVRILSPCDIPHDELPGDPGPTSMYAIISL